MYEKYISDGVVERGVIANEFARRKLTKSDARALDRIPEVRASYIGETYRDKVADKSKWDKKYLDELACVAIAKSWNLDYMLYLDEVAAEVDRKGRRISRLIRLALALLAIGAVLAVIAIYAEQFS